MHGQTWRNQRDLQTKVWTSTCLACGFMCASNGLMGEDDPCPECAKELDAITKRVDVVEPYEALCPNVEPDQIGDKVWTHYCSECNGRAYVITDEGQALLKFMRKHIEDLLPYRLQAEEPD